MSWDQNCKYFIIPPALGASDPVMVERVNIDIAPLPVFTSLPFIQISPGSYTIIPPALGAGNQIIVQRVNVDKNFSPGVYCSPGPVKYRPAFIETISPNKSEWPTNICNIKYTFFEYRQFQN